MLAPTCSTAFKGHTSAGADPPAAVHAGAASTFPDPLEWFGSVTAYRTASKVVHILVIGILYSCQMITSNGMIHRRAGPDGTGMSHRLRGAAARAPDED